MKPLLPLIAAALVISGSAGSFAQNLSVLNSQTTNSRETLSSNQTLAVYATASITKPSPGEFEYAIREKAWQTNGTGWGRSAEYRMKIRGGNYGGILYSDTPTNATL